ncbi:putative pollen-specific protein C13 [Iris pallida]|uniref:Pollen-specific protein C13 n=1 Tax=Iris pallida TaxID=29817 RepID=A0AAX6HRD7_IRIPA|nr:putative pollen-specific protein C13 [Iris pallida]
MAKSSFLIAAAVAVSVAVVILPSSVVCGARVAPTNGFTVNGRVFCDTCVAGFETPATTYVAGAQVRVECRTRDTKAKTCSFDGVTDSTGTYNIQVAGEHEYEICESVLVSSPDGDCSLPLMGRERAPVLLTHNNGMPSDTRVVNALGFKKNAPLAWCASLMKMYEVDEDYRIIFG